MGFEFKTELPSDRITKTYSDGKKVTLTPVEFILEELAHGVIENVKLDSSFCIREYYKDDMFTGSVIFELMSDVREKVLTEYMERGKYKEIEQLFNTSNQYVLHVTDYIFNKLSIRLYRYMQGIDVLDLLEFHKHELLMDAKTRLNKDPNVKNIDLVYKAVSDVAILLVGKNTLATSYVAKTVKPKQINQMVGCRGYCIDLGGRIFRDPIVYSFLEGMKDIYALSVESRSAANALFKSTTAIQDSEWLARELVLNAMYMEKLVHTDCGTKEGLNWFMEPPGLKDGGKFYVGDLDKFIGIQYRLSEDSKDVPWKIIKKTDTHLHGKNIVFRSTKTCGLPNEKHVCLACFGTIGAGLSDHVTIGALALIYHTARVSQLVLSAKHHIDSGGDNKFVLDATSAKFLKYIYTEEVFRLQTTALKNKHKRILKISTDQFKGLTNLLITKELNVDNKRVSYITNFIIEEINKNDEVTTYPIDISISGSKGAFSYAFLKHCIEVGYMFTEADDTYSIDITEFNNPKEDFINLRKATQDIENFVATVSKLLKENKEDFHIFLAQLFSLVNSEVTVHMSFLNMVAYTFTAVDMEAGDYRMCRGTQRTDMASVYKSIANRSMSAVMGFGYVSQIFNLPNSTREDRYTHPLDVLFDPVGYIEDYYEKRGEHSLYM